MAKAIKHNKDRFVLRKLTTGLASVMLCGTFLLNNTHTVHADVKDNSKPNEENTDAVKSDLNDFKTQDDFVTVTFVDQYGNTIKEVKANKDGSDLESLIPDGYKLSDKKPNLDQDTTIKLTKIQAETSTINKNANNADKTKLTVNKEANKDESSNQLAKPSTKAKVAPSTAKNDDTGQTETKDDDNSKKPETAKTDSTSQTEQTVKKTTPNNDTQVKKSQTSKSANVETENSVKTTVNKDTNVKKQDVAKPVKKTDPAKNVKKDIVKTPITKQIVNANSNEKSVNSIKKSPVNKTVNKNANNNLKPNVKADTIDTNANLASDDSIKMAINQNNGLNLTKQLKTSTAKGQNNDYSYLFTSLVQTPTSAGNNDNDDIQISNVNMTPGDWYPIDPFAASQDMPAGVDATLSTITFHIHANNPASLKGKTYTIKDTSAVPSSLYSAENKDQQITLNGKIIGNLTSQADVIGGDNTATNTKFIDSAQITFTNSDELNKVKSLDFDVRLNINPLHLYTDTGDDTKNISTPINIVLQHDNNTQTIYTGNVPTGSTNITHFATSFDNMMTNITITNPMYGHFKDLNDKITHNYSTLTWPNAQINATKTQFSLGNQVEYSINIPYSTALMPSGINYAVHIPKSLKSSLNINDSISDIKTTLAKSYTTQSSMNAVLKGQRINMDGSTYTPLYLINNLETLSPSDFNVTINKDTNDNDDIYNVYIQYVGNTDAYRTYLIQRTTNTNRNICDAPNLTFTFNVTPHINTSTNNLDTDDPNATDVYDTATANAINSIYIAPTMQNGSQAGYNKALYPEAFGSVLVPAPDINANAIGKNGKGQLVFIDNIDGQRYFSVPFNATVGQNANIDTNNINQKLKDLGLKISDGYNVPKQITLTNVDMGDVVIKVDLTVPTKTINETKNVTRQIVISGPRPDTITQTATLTRTGTKDMRTGVVTWDNYNDGHWDSVDLSKYVPDNTYEATINGDKANQVDAEVVTNNTPNSVINVNVDKKEITVTLHYIDTESGREVQTGTIKGHPGATITTTDSITPGYKLVSSPNIKIDPNKTNVNLDVARVPIHVPYNEPKAEGDYVPGSEAIKYPAGVNYNDLNHTVTRTINIMSPDAETQVVVQKVQMVRDADFDPINLNIKYTPWRSLNGSNDLPVFKVDKSRNPEIDGDAEADYDGNIPSQSVIDEDGNLIDNQTVDLTYNSSKAMLVVNFVDKTKSDTTVKQAFINGNTGDYIDLASNSESKMPANYHFLNSTEEDKYNNGYTMKDAASNELTIYVAPDTKDVTQNDPKANATVTRTINVTYPDGSQKQIVQKAIFKRKAIQNKATGEITYGDWMYQDSNGEWTKGTTTHFDKINVPNETGYTINTDGDSDYMLITPESKPSTVNIVYKGNSQTNYVEFVDDDNNEKPVGGRYFFTQGSGQTIQIHPNVPTDYDLAQGQNLPTSYTFLPANNKPIIVHVIHHKDKINNDDAPLYDFKRVITRDVYINTPDGQTIHKTQTATFTRSGVQDSVNGQVQYSNWDKDHVQFNQINVPSYEGYSATADVPTVTITPDSKSSTVTINYTAENSTLHVTYIDTQTGLSVGTQDFTGKTGDINQLNFEIPNNYVATQDVDPTYQFKGGHQEMTVKVKHKTETEPETSQLDRIVNFKDENGKTIHDPITQEASITRNKVRDLATGQTSYTPWTNAEFYSMDLPQIDGYSIVHPPMYMLNALSADPAQGNVNFDAIYGVNKTPILPTQDTAHVNYNYLDADNNDALVTTKQFTGKPNTTVTLDIASGLPAGYEFVTPSDASIQYNMQYDNADENVYIRKINKGTDNNKPEAPKDSHVDVHFLSSDDWSEIPDSSYTVNGKVGNKVNLNLSSHVPNGYHLANKDEEAKDQHTLVENGDSVNVYVTKDEHKQDDKPQATSVNVNYVDYDTGKVLLTKNWAGNVGQKLNLNIAQFVPSSYKIGDSADTIKQENEYTLKETNDDITINLLKIQDPTKPTVTPAHINFNFVDTDSNDQVGDVYTINGNAGDVKSVDILSHIPKGYHLPKDYTPISSYTLKENDPDITIPVIKDEHQIDPAKQDAHVNFNFVDSDSNNKIGDTYTVNGKVGDTVNLDVQGHVPSGYHIVDKKIPSTYKFGTNNDDISIYIAKDEHKTDPTKQDAHVNINYVDNDTNDQIGKAYTVDGKVGDTVNLDVQGHVPSGYHIVEEKIPNQYTFGTDNGDIVIHVVKDTKPVDPTKQDAHVNFNYVDNDSNDKIGDTYTVTGKVGDTVKVNVQNHVPSGYHIVDDQIPSQYTFGTDNGDISIHVVKDTKPVDPTKQDAHVYVNFVDDNGNQVGRYEVTGKQGDKKALNIQANVPSGYHITDSEIIDQYVFKGNGADTDIVVNVAKTTTPVDPTKQNAHININYVDNDSNNQIGKAYTVNGKVGDTVDLDVQGHVPSGYHIVEEKIPSQYTFGTDNGDIVIHVIKDSTPVDPTKQDAHVNINFVDDNGNQVGRYEVTGKQGDKKALNIKNNVPSGYHITDSEIIDQYVFKGNGADTDIVVNVAKNTTPVDPTKQDAHVNINYVDNDTNAKIGDTYTLNGKVGDTVDVDAQGHVPNGYHIVDKQVINKYKFGTNNDDITIYIAKDGSDKLDDKGESTISYNYVDDITGKQVGRQTYKGEVGKDVTLDLDKHIPSDYVLGPSEKLPSTYTMKADGQNSDQIVYVRHVTGPDEKNNAQVHINYVINATDEVVGVYTAKGKSGDTIKLDIAGNVPKGYHIADDNVPKEFTLQNYNMDQVIFVLPDDSQPTKQDVSFIINFKDSNGTILKKLTVSGKDGDTIKFNEADIMNTLPNYEVSTDEASSLLGQKLTTNMNGKEFNVILKKKNTTPVTPTNNDVKITINVVDESGTILKSLDISGKTGDTINFDKDSLLNNFKDYDVISDNAKTLQGEKFTKDMNGSSYTIMLKKKDSTPTNPTQKNVSFTINFVDEDNSNVLKTLTVSGKVGDTINFDENSVLKEFSNYSLTSNDIIDLQGQKFTDDMDGQNYTVTLKKNSDTPSNPDKPDKPNDNNDKPVNPNNNTGNKDNPNSSNPNNTDNKDNTNSSTPNNNMDNKDNTNPSNPNNTGNKGNPNPSNPNNNIDNKDNTNPSNPNNTDNKDDTNSSNPNNTDNKPNSDDTKKDSNESTPDSKDNNQTSDPVKKALSNYRKQNQQDNNDSDSSSNGSNGTDSDNKYDDDGSSDNSNDDNDLSNANDNNSNDNPESSNKELPQTGSAQDNTTVTAELLIGLAGLMLLAVDRKKKKDDQNNRQDKITN